MTNRYNLLLRWTARTLSALCLGIIMMFIIGEGFNPTKLKVNEWLLFIFFPFGVAIGMVIAWWKENIGGLITIGCFILFYVVHYITNGWFPHGFAFFIFSSPGIVFILSWHYNHKKNKSAA
jgi:hypothetical protein